MAAGAVTAIQTPERIRGAVAVAALPGRVAMEWMDLLRWSEHRVALAVVAWAVSGVNPVSHRWLTTTAGSTTQDTVQAAVVVEARGRTLTPPVFTAVAVVVDVG